MAERGCRQQIEAVGNRRADDVTVVMVVDREGLGERVVERQIVFIVEAHGLIFDRALDAIVRLFGQIVDANKTVVGARFKHVVRCTVVALLVTTRPAVIEVRRRAIVVGVKRHDRWTGIVRIRIGTGIRAVRVNRAT
jgi:hypothetical protein